MNKSKAIMLICSLMLGVILLLIGIVSLIFGGMLGLNRTELIISTGSVEAMYDGTPLTNHTWDMVKGKLKNGHQINVTFTASQTAVGERPNTMEITVTDAVGADVSSDYKIKFQYGTLRVYPRIMGVKTADAEKQYDGMPLFAPDYEISDLYSELVKGHFLKIDITGSITEIGMAPNRVDSISIFDRFGNDVTANYQLIIQEGMLAVYGDIGGVGGGGGSGGSGGGQGGSLNTGGQLGAGNFADEPTKVIMKIRSDKTGKIYFRLHSFGDFSGQSWGAAEEFPHLIENRYSYNYLTGIRLQTMSADSGFLEIQSYTDDYLLPYYLGKGATNYTIQTSDVSYSGEDTSEYSMRYFIYNGTGEGITPVTSSEELAYRMFVYEKYLSVDDETRAFMEQIIAEQEFIRGERDLIGRVASYIQSCATYSKEYDRTLDQQSNVVISFLRDYKEGICQHYASSATLLYRTLGIPARYVVGYTGESVAGEWCDVTTPGHAWTEIYLSGIGWIPVEVTGGIGGGNGGGGGADDPDRIVFSPSKYVVQYDGSSHEVPDQIRAANFEQYIEQGYTFKGVVRGNATEIGYSQSYIEKLTILDPFGNDVTDQFEFSLAKGVIHVYEYQVVFQSPNVNKVYDGKTAPTADFREGYILPEHSYRITSTASVDVGVGRNTFTVEIFDADGNDVSERYYIMKISGEMNIQHAPLSVKAGDASKIYDGTALTNDTYTVESGSLIEGHSIAECVISGSQTEVGRSDNTIESIKIVDEDGNDVTSNYQIELLTGKLKVTYN